MDDVPAAQRRDADPIAFFLGVQVAHPREHLGQRQQKRLGTVVLIAL
ncbi:hypothetical protein [Streptomyces griseoflavus]